MTTVQTSTLVRILSVQLPMIHVPTNLLTNLSVNHDNLTYIMTCQAELILCFDCHRLHSIYIKGQITSNQKWDCHKCRYINNTVRKNEY